MAPNGGTDTTPIWDNPETGACGTCHGATAASPPLRGSHQTHAGVMHQIACTVCHYNYGSKHVNGSVNWAYDSTTYSWLSDALYRGDISGSATPVPSTSYGQCSNLYCHSNVQGADGNGPPTFYAAPTWGGALSCGNCHASTMTAGSHIKHTSAPYSYACTNCHTSQTAINHSDHYINFVISYSQGASSIPGNGYGTCSNISCHSDGTYIWTGGSTSGTSPQWGSGSLSCNGCHGNTTYTDYRKGTPLYSSYPGGTKPNAHVLHTDARTTPSGEPQCNNCHRSVTNSNTAIDGTTPSNHVDSAYNVVGGNTYKDGDNVGGAAVSVTTTYSYSGTPNTSTCSNVSCHPTGLAGTKAASITMWSNAYSCTDCHKINMNNTSGYHHVMDTTATTDRTYPTSAPSSSETDSNRKCTMCHVDHNIFSPMLNTNVALTQPRAMNLRTAIGTTPTTATGYTNSDYAAGGGICISCHTNERTKNATAQKSETGSTVTVAVTDAQYSASAHQYNIASTMTNGSTTFNSNCSKCHNAKNGEITTFQSSTNKFGTHDKTLRRLFASLGMTSSTDPEEEDFCYRCHSKTTDTTPGGGPAKGTAGRDYYGTAGATMTAAAEDIFTVMQRGTAEVPDSSTTATNTLYFKPTAEETVSGAAPTDHYTTTSTTDVIYLKRRADDSTLGTSYPNAYFINSGTYNATTYWRRVMTPVSGGTNENTAYFSPSGTPGYQRHAQFISLPLASNWTINDGQSFTLNIEDYEGSNASNGYTRYNVRRYTGSTGGTVVNTAAACESGAEMGNNSSATYYMQTITCSNDTGSAITFNTGDYIVLEVETTNKATTTSSFRELWGNNNARLTLPSDATFNTEPIAGGTANIRSMSPFAPTVANETVGGTETVGTNASAINTVTQRWKRVAFVSPPVATATTTTAAAWTINIYDRESSVNANARVRYMIYSWTSAGAFGSTIVPRTTNAAEMGLPPTAVQNITTAAGNAVSLAVGDKIVVDLEIETNLVSAGGSYALEYTFGSTSQSRVVMPNNITFNYGFTPGTSANGRHDVANYSGKHKPSAKDEDTKFTTNRHVECADCHNPHAAKQGAHTPSDQWYPTSPSSTTNNVSNAITGVTGIEPTWPSIWTVPTTFTSLSSATKESQICFKCHSYKGLQDADGVSIYITSDVLMTDQAMEFNPKNYSLHPVTINLGNTTVRGTGSGAPYAPLSLTANQMLAPWTNVGSQTMYCSDCHGTDNENAGDPKGPHASSYKYMLKGPNKYWPTKSDGTTLWELSDVTSTGPADLFCRNCHPILDGSGWKNNVHSQSMGMNGGHQNITCVECHVAVPHGAKRSRLIGYGTNATNPDPAPYDYNGNSLKITGFRKASSPTDYNQKGPGDHNCTTSGIMGCHGNSITDPDP
jgi:predicted CxxxxCH...CXXCH cytochrome family protein